jgi:hypothetical protein
MACDRPHDSQRCTRMLHFSWDPFFECGITFGLVITCTSTCLGRERMVRTTGQSGRIGAMESIFDSSITAPNALLASIQSMTPACTCGASGRSVVWNDKLAISYPRDHSSSVHISPREFLVPQCSDEYSREFGELCSHSPTRCMLEEFLPLGHQLTELMGLLTTPHMYRLII